MVYSSEWEILLPVNIRMLLKAFTSKRLVSLSTSHQEKHLPAPSSSPGRLILSKQVPGDQRVVLTKFNIASEK